MSALRSSAGAAVCTSGASSSAAMMWASEVLPRPGGPESRTWSSGSPRRRAASMKTSSWLVTCSWATNSARLRRSQRAVELVLAARLWRWPSARPRSGCTAIRVAASMLGSGTIPRDALVAHRQPLAPLSVEPRSAASISSSGVSPSARAEQRLGLGERVAEVHQPVASKQARLGRLGARRFRAQTASSSSPVTFSRSSTMTRSAVRLPIPGTAWKRLASPAAIARSSSRGLPPERIAMRDLGPDAADRDQMQEEVALLLAGEAVERHRVVADDQVRVQHRLLAAGRHGLQRLGGDGELVADAAGLDDDVVGPADKHLAADRGDHEAATARATAAVAIASRGANECEGRTWLAWQIATARASAA